MEQALSVFEEKRCLGWGDVGDPQSRACRESKGEGATKNPRGTHLFEKER